MMRDSSRAVTESSSPSTARIARQGHLASHAQYSDQDQMVAPAWGRARTGHFCRVD